MVKVILRPSFGLILDFGFLVVSFGGCGRSFKFRLSRWLLAVLCKVIIFGCCGSGGISFFLFVVSFFLFLFFIFFFFFFLLLVIE